MTYLQYAQKIMEGCDKFYKSYKDKKENEIITQCCSNHLCPECQRARQTAIDLGKRDLPHLSLETETLSWLIGYFRGLNIKVPPMLIKQNERAINEFKDIQEGLKVLGVEA